MRGKIHDILDRQIQNQLQHGNHTPLVEVKEYLIELENQLSELCPIGDLSVIESLKLDKKYMQDEIKDLQECEDYLVKIREEICDIEYESGVLEYAIAKPEGIYEMVKELKKKFNKYDKVERNKSYVKGSNYFN